MQLEHGKKARVGNYEVLKYSKSLSKKELKQLREGATDELPAAVKECLQRSSLSYIKVSTISGSWSVEFVVGTTMYDAESLFHSVISLGNVSTTFKSYTTVLCPSSKLSITSRIVTRSFIVVKNTSKRK